MVTINKNGEKKLEKLIEEKRKQKELALKELHAKEQALEKIAKESGDPKNKQITEVKYWALTNAEALKDFIMYGANKVTDQIRVRTQANLQARAEIDALKKKKEGIDPKTVAFTIMVIAIVGVVCFVVINSFLNYNSVAKELNDVRLEAGKTAGQLASCQIQLERYQPTQDTIREINAGPAANTTSSMTG